MRKIIYLKGEINIIENLSTLITIKEKENENYLKNLIEFTRKVNFDLRNNKTTTVSSNIDIIDKEVSLSILFIKDGDIKKTINFYCDTKQIKNVLQFNKSNNNIINDIIVSDSNINIKNKIFELIIKIF